MSNDENREKNEEKAAVPVQPIIDMGSTVVKNSRGTVHCLTIVGQVEGHTLLPDNLKSTKYEHVLPLLASLEESDEVDGLVLLLNTVGGDIEAGLAIAELAAGMTKPVVTLVLGGAASGKSEYAEALVLRSALPRYYLATMQVWDAECAARVEKHRKMRAAKQFETIECPLHLEAVRLSHRGTALLEDLGNLTATERYAPAGAGDAAAEHILQGLDSLAAQCENLIVVSNEVFSGGADYAGDTDRYLLALAQVNNALAARADAVVRVVCGVPVYYKGVEK